MGTCRRFYLTLVPLADDTRHAACFSDGACMAFELAAYGAISGLMHRFLPRKKPYIYVSLLTAMLVGRLIWGAAMLICMGITGGSFAFTAFLSGAVLNAVPGLSYRLYSFRL